MKLRRKCPECGETFWASQKQKKFCNKCIHKFYFRRARKDPKVRAKQQEYNRKWIQRNWDRHLELCRESYYKTSKSRIIEKLKKYQKTLPELKITFKI